MLAVGSLGLPHPTIPGDTIHIVYTWNIVGMVFPTPLQLCGFRLFVNQINIVLTSMELTILYTVVLLTKTEKK